MSDKELHLLDAPYSKSIWVIPEIPLQKILLSSVVKLTLETGTRRIHNLVPQLKTPSIYTELICIS